MHIMRIKVDKKTTVFPGSAISDLNEALSSAEAKEGETLYVIPVHVCLEHQSLWDAISPVFTKLCEPCSAVD